MTKPVYVLRFPQPLTDELVATAKDRLRKHLGDVDALIVVLGDGASLDVIHVPNQLGAARVISADDARH